MRVRELRIRKLYSIRGLAKTAGVTGKTVRTTETGQSIPSLSTIRKLSQVLEVDPMEVDEFKDAITRAIGNE